MFIEELGRELIGRNLAIWQGPVEGLAEHKRQAYIRAWKKQAGQPVGAIPRADQSEPEPCPHLGPPTGEMVGCRTCNKASGAKVEVYSCALHGRCTVSRAPAANDIHCCRGCDDHPENVRRRESRRKVAAVPVSKPHHLPVEMVMPSQKRPHIYRGGILQIHVTRACDRACNNCTQGSNLKGRVEFISPDLFRCAVESLKDYFGVVGIFGGNPCLHPQFDELCKILRGAIPFEQRGLWSNHPKGKGKVAAVTFNPAFSNLNVHQSQEAYDEFAHDWPQCRPYLKGLDSDSRHSPPFVAMRDVIPDEADRWRLIQDCDINRNWSAMVGVFRGQLRGWFCEIAGAQASLHQDEPEYPDTGVPITPGWWKQGQDAFAHQIKKHCHECGVPLRGRGALANGDEPSQFSETHASIYRTRGGKTEQATELIQLGSPLKRITDYIENGSIK